MTTERQAPESLGTEFETREAGVTDLMEFYEKVEGIYVDASAFMAEAKGTYVTDSTNAVRADADLGRNPVLV